MIENNYKYFFNLIINSLRLLFCLQNTEMVNNGVLALLHIVISAFTSIEQ